VRRRFAIGSSGVSSSVTRLRLRVVGSGACWSSRGGGWDGSGVLRASGSKFSEREGSVEECSADGFVLGVEGRRDVGELDLEFDMQRGDICQTKKYEQDLKHSQYMARWQTHEQIGGQRLITKERLKEESPSCVG